MKKPPTSTNSFKYYQSDTDNFTVCVEKLENASDPDAAASRLQCPGGPSTSFCVCSD